MRTLRTLLVSVLMMGSGAGLLAAAQHARAGSDPVRTPGPDDPPPAREGAPRPVVVVADPTAGGTEQKVTALADRMAGIETKLDALGARSAPTGPGDEVLITPPQNRSPEEQESMDAASQIVDAAVESGNWLDGDQGRMREVAARLLPGDRFTLHMKLAAAANAGWLKDFATQPFFF